MSDERHESLSSRALDALLDDDNPESKELKEIFEAEKIHRTVLWRYRTGRGKPEVGGAAKIERITGGRVPANGWEDIEKAPDSESKPNGHQGAA
jgi:hypothetical protein